MTANALYCILSQLVGMYRDLMPAVATEDDRSECCVGLESFSNGSASFRAEIVVPHSATSNRESA